MSFIYIYYLLRDSIPDRKNIERKPYGNSHWMRRLWNPLQYRLKMEAYYVIYFIFQSFFLDIY